MVLKDENGNKDNNGAWIIPEIAAFSIIMLFNDVLLSHRLNQ